MFFIKRKNTIKEQREEIKRKSLEITSLISENTHLRMKNRKIADKIKNFDFIKDNPFGLINEIKKELKD